MVVTKREDVRKLHIRESLLSVHTYSITEFEWEGALGSVLIRGWAVIRINTVLCQNK